MLTRKSTFALLMAAFLLYPAEIMTSEQQPTPEVTVRIVYNNIPGGPDSGLTAAGGFGAWIEFKNSTILFDAGGNSTILIENLESMGRDLGKLDTVFISHNHWDHVYGLPSLLSLTAFRPKLYVPHPSRDAISEQNPRATILSSDDPHAIQDGVWSTGSMKVERFGAILTEQSMVVDTSKGLLVITGCSHPGIVRIVEQVKEMLPGKPIALVAGGFHLRSHGEKEIREISAKLRQLGVKKLGPSHCTGQAAIRHFQEEWKDDFVKLYLGDEHRF